MSLYSFQPLINKAYSQEKISLDLKVDSIYNDTIKHNQGNVYHWNAIQNNDYLPRTNQILKQNIEPNDLVTGGFDEDLKLFSNFGTYTLKTNQKDIEELIKRHSNQIHKKIEPNLNNLLKDHYLFVSFKQFFEDGGRINIWSSGGKYDRNPLALNIGVYDSKNVEDILFHELLHYVLDKKDLNLTKVYDTSGADHKLISPLEERFQIIRSINKGIIPSNLQLNSGLNGFTLDGKIGNRINSLIENQNLIELRDYINSDEFKKGYVRSSMTSVLSSNERNKNVRNFITQLSDKKYLRIIENYDLSNDTVNINNFSNDIYIDVKIQDFNNFNIEKINQYIPKEDKTRIGEVINEYQKDKNKNRSYVLSNEELIDIAFLNAMNGAIINQAINIGIDISKNDSINIKEAFKTKEFNKQFNNFLKNYVSNIEKNENQPYTILN